jgi:hypothetical protein
MAAKKKPATEQATSKDSVTVYCKDGDNPDRATAKTLAQPETQAAITIQQYQGNIVDVNQIAEELREQTKSLKAGKMDRAEEMLLAQAHTLDELFNNLAKRACRQEYMSSYESFLKLAFKAQNQCRMTLETLSNIKNPPVIYTKQANISNGPQQINNNGVPAPRTRKNQKLPNELLEVIDGERLDTRATKETIGDNSAMATLE